METMRNSVFAAAGVLLVLMTALAGGAAWRESVTVDEVAHIGAGVSYLQKLDLRLNEEHPPLPKVLAALPLVLRGTRADYSHISWTFSDTFLPAYLGQWVFGYWVLAKWNDPVTELRWARSPMLALTLVLGWVLFWYGRRLGGDRGGLLCLSIYVSTPAFLVFGPLVHTDIAVTLFSLVTLWRFAEVWREPGRRNEVLFGLAFAGALLSKFTAGILLFVFVAVALSTRWRAVAGQPADKAELRAWRRRRWRFTLRGILWAALAVYAVYFLLSLHQSTDVLNRVGHGAAWVPLRRLLMPPWLYLRGVLLVLITGSRPTFVLGHSYSHGVWFYFPIIFVLKSAMGFLGLLVLALGLALRPRRAVEGESPVVPCGYAMHWRVLWVALVVFTVFCLISRLTISIRHFTVPLILLIILLAPLPSMVERLWRSAPIAGRAVSATVAALALSCLVTAVQAYPYFFPYVNALGFGRPAYTLVNDSNLDWNQSLPKVRKFADRNGLRKIAVDEYGFSDLVDTIPQAEMWNCQTPSAADDGQWVVISAGMVMDGHNCVWLMQYPHQALAGGSMYAVRLPEKIPPAGSAGGPPLASAFREFGGFPFDTRSFFLGVTRNPETLPKAFGDMVAKFGTSSKASSKVGSPASVK